MPGFLRRFQPLPLRSPQAWSLQCRVNISHAKVVTGIEQRSGTLFFQRVGEAIPKVQSATRAKPLTVIYPGLHRCAGRTIIDGGYVDAEDGKKSIQVGNRLATVSGEMKN
ncbi:hypothetical protein [Sinorhizobium medicae]|uniref:hypothetical protein n=1 Tax=Sinorhizobium medicae TaxID=110321 RepID=UPI000418E309|nr:hypothetical protein [Sinorhizobium medicae]